MAQPVLPILMLALAAPAAIPGPDGPRPVGMRLEQVIVHERIIVRVPMAQPAPLAGGLVLAAPVRWKEKKGPKCIAAANMAGAMVMTVREVDLVLRGGQRVRARLGGACKPLDFYSGFYLRPASDGMICADRDVLRTQSGTSCPINGFSTLVPKR